MAALLPKTSKMAIILPNIGYRNSIVQGWNDLLYLLYILYRRKNLLYSYIGGPKHTKAPIFYIPGVHVVSVEEVNTFVEA